MRRSIALMLACAAILLAQQGDLEAVVETDAGSFRIEFAPDKAPKHVEQFLKLVRHGVM